MNSELTTYITLVCTSSVLIIYLCLYVFIKRHKFRNIANLFILYSISITIYCIGSAFGLLSTTLQEMKFWTMIQYIGMPVSCPLGLLFIMHYLGIKITKRKWIPLIVIPFISLIMVMTNDIHHFHYRVYEFDPVLGAPFIHQEIGLWYIIHGMFTFACMFIAFFLLISHWKETAKIYRPQLISLLFGQLVPMLTAFLYLIGVTPPGIDPVPMVLWLTSLLYVWAISSSRLFTIMPIAKDAIFNSINDGVIVLDESDRIIEFNQACEMMFPNINKSMLGEDFVKVWTHLSGNPFPYTIEPNIHHELQLSSLEKEEKIYQVRSTKVQKRNNSNGLLLLFTDITELKKLQEKLEYQAYYDDLTQIYNRRAFFKQCQQSLDESIENTVAFSVILIDIDFFKKVNDTYGHYVGDQLLVHVVQVCKAQLKDGILFARYGGEEFVLALKGYTAADAEALANQIRSEMELSSFTTSKENISVTLSLGVAESNGTGELLYQILNKADQALYSAKHSGRNQVHVYTEPSSIHTV